MADFTNIDGVYAKDTELRSGIDTLRTTVLSNTIKPLTVTKNDTYTAIPSSGTYGYSPIIVNTPAGADIGIVDEAVYYGEGTIQQ